ncbi:enoyl-CoA hydratase/isomerase family protein [Nocardioides sp. AE5]|uniref:enoyl-CoA hydratase/isomerase family protein n=1 Tax=Nocardioides sp. AE5 TaxID=2962573 RepID=UPI0028827BE8|nr:enoyl-CoA hydratase/isomerase family protein [Nocardioides sp. AE5]MDT0200910.1 enoyl-CoA hydratase/isomerase family protein [Nocardioides sp. AE5]
MLWVHLQRPEVLNSINEEMVDGLAAALDRASAKDVRVMVIRGTGRAFCAGADLVQVPGEEVDTSRMEQIVERVAAVVGGIAKLPKPVIAGVNGITAAGGLEIVLACDLVVAVEGARIADAHSNYGLLPGAGGSARLPRAVGTPMAKRMMLTGDFVTAEELVASGFVTAVVPIDQLDECLEELSTSLALRSPRVMTAMKHLADGASDITLAEACDAEAVALRAYLKTPDVHAGLAAFREGKRPEFED